MVPQKFHWMGQNLSIIDTCVIFTLNFGLTPLPNNSDLADLTPCGASCDAESSPCYYRRRRGTHGEIQPFIQSVIGAERRQLARRL